MRNKNKVLCQQFETLKIIWNFNFQTNVLQVFQPFKRQPHKMVKHTQKIHRLLPANWLSVFDHFVGLALKGLNEYP